MRLRSCLTVVMLCITVSVSAQRKQIGEARTILKSGKNFERAEQLMTNLLKDSANQQNKRIHEIWWQSVQKQYEQANERFYMKKQQDTTQFFSLVRRLFTIAERLDSLDARPDKKGRVAPDLRTSVASHMSGYRPNLFFGGAYFVRKADFRTAFDYFETYIDCQRQPLFTGYDFEQTDARMPEAAYWSAYCGYRLQDPVLTLRYHKLALRDSARADFTLQYVAEAWRWLKIDSMYVVTLHEGFSRYPKSPYFFPRLIDYYNQKADNQKALQVVDEALKTDSLNQLFLHAKTVVLLNMEQYAQSLDYSQRLMALYPEMPEPYYHVGTAYLNIALRMDSRRHRKQIRKMYQNALAPLEKYRQMAPDEKQKWGPALYRVYFNLNMGKQFDEIDKILKN